MKIDYGKDGLEFKINPSWNVTILHPNELKPLKNPVHEIRVSINNPIKSPPLRKIIERKKKIDTICIVVSDSTRPVPSHLILQALIEELYHYKIADKQIQILIATGLHRQSREDEINRIVGKDFRNKLKIIDHIATDKDTLKYLGLTSNNIPIYINKAYLESDLKILTGYVEPHFFFGFSGGRKSIVPGIAGEETIQGNHSAENVASPYSRFGIYKENPMHKNAIEITKMVKADFIVNVCINEKHEIVNVASGNLKKVHQYLVKYQLKNILKRISEPYDIVVCGNGGYPLDLNLYQAVKSMAIGEMAVKKNGIIIAVNELSEGIGHANFSNLIYSNTEPKKLYQQILNGEIIVSDQWEIQILARILMKAEIFVISKLKEDQIGNIGLKYANSVEEAIQYGLNKFGNHAKILILPNGPQVLPLIKK